MYQFSRSMYRELAEFVVPDPGGCIAEAKSRLLGSCEAAVERLAADRHYFARPARSLFNDVRMLFPLSKQLRATQEAIRELSTPVLQVRERLLILPIVGVIDTQRAT